MAAKSQASEAQEDHAVEQVAQRMDPELAPRRGPPGQPLGELVMVERVEGAEQPLERDQDEERFHSNSLHGLKHAVLKEGLAEPGMADGHGEAEPAVRFVTVDHMGRAGGEQGWNR
jgi:hypothetical protein